MTHKPSQCDVLVVDDEVMLSDTIANSLKRDGLDVRGAHSGSSALRAAETCKPRVAVLDYQLPDMTGVELATRLHAVVPDLAIILMSGGIGDVPQTTLKAANIKVFVNKPVPLAPLKQAVHRLLQAKR